MITSFLGAKKGASKRSRPKLGTYIVHVRYITYRIPCECLYIYIYMYTCKLYMYVHGVIKCTFTCVYTVHALCDAQQGCYQH